MQQKCNICKEEKFIKWYAGWIVKDYDETIHFSNAESTSKSPGLMSPCFICSLPFSPERSTVLTLTGMCGRSYFDKYYQMDNDEKGLVTPVCVLETHSPLFPGHVLKTHLHWPLQQDGLNLKEMCFKAVENIL